MFNYTDIKDIHLELTSKCQVKCPMCPRRINSGIENPLISITEIDLPIFKKWFSVDFLRQLNSLFMCGNLGDPIVAQDCLEIFQYIRECNPHISLSMHTNGSARSKHWWKELSKTNVRVVFGIDGLADTHSLYRVGADWNKIIENAASFINEGGIAEWHMLVFRHNEHQVDACRNMSKELGFVDFKEKHTSRFMENKWHVLDDAGRTIHILYPTDKSTTMIPKVQDAKSGVCTGIKCKAQTMKQIYVSADGTVSPCCWLDFSWILPKQDTRIDYMDRIGEFPNLQDLSLEDIFKSGYFEKIADTWKVDPLKECAKQCGNFDKLMEQFNAN